MLISEYPVLSVHVPPTLRDFTKGHAELTGSGETVGEVLAGLAQAYPAFGRRLFCADGRLAEGISLYLGGFGQSRLVDLATPVEPDELLSLMTCGEIACTQPSVGQTVLPLRGEAAPISIGT